MCGVVGGLGKPDARSLDAIAHRGPDARGVYAGARFWLGHVRLSILDLDDRSNQPFHVGRTVVSYNGELWNYEILRAALEKRGRTFRTTGDTEVVTTALDEWGDGALELFEGMFAIAWTQDGGETVKLARDRFGEVPLHVFIGERVAFASELAALVALGCDPRGFRWVEPGTVWTFSSSGARVARWYQLPTARYEEWDVEQARAAIRVGVRVGTRERAISDVPVCTLLSGGVDSAAVLAHLVEVRPDVVAYVAVHDPKSPDLRAAREMAERYGVELREVRIVEPTSADLEGVVRAIEMPHKAQVEIAWACDALARAMRADGFRVTFSGEGSDELWASYGMSYHGVQQKGWYAFRRELFLGQHRKNFARCNKVFMRHGVECRLPFLSTGLVETALALPENLVRDGRARPKAVLQDSHADLLPERVVRRPKLAFQDGMGIKDACARAAGGDPESHYRDAFARAFPGAKT